MPTVRLTCSSATRRDAEAARGRRCRRRMLFVVPVATVLVSLALAPFSASAWAVPGLPANTGCTEVAVLAKLGVIEDRAAANVLAEALSGLSGGGRCLLDVGAPSTGEIPAASRREVQRAGEVFVVGGPGAIPDSWLRSGFGLANYVRIAGGNRWETQAAVAAAIISVATGQEIGQYVSSTGSAPVLPPNTDCGGTSVVAKLGVVEDRAAANMLAEALTYLSTFGLSRCLIGVGDPSTGAPPESSGVEDARQSTDSYVVGGTTAIPDSWLREHFGIRDIVRVAGADRWETQASVASLIVSLAKELGATGHAAEPDSTESDSTELDSDVDGIDE